MNLPAAWDMTAGCANIKIAVIDDGVQLNHPDLVANMLPGFDATNSGTNGGHVAGEEMHGTNCAGFAAATGNNGIGTAGVAYKSKIIPIRAFSTNLASDITLDQFITSAINHAVNVKGADILCMSWGLVASNPAIDAAIYNALNNVAISGRNGKGTILIGAVGNSYNLAASSSSPGTTYNYNNYAGSGNMTIDLYTPNNPTTQMYVYSNSTDGLRQVKLTATNACGNYAEDFVFYLESGFKIYPNPAKEKITLEFANAHLLAAMPSKLELFDEKTMQPVRSVVIKDIFDKKGFREGNKLDLNVSDLPRGTYYLHATRSENSKEVVEKLRLILE